MGKTKSYKAHLKGRLKNPKKAVGYYSAVLKDGDTDVFYLVIKDIINAFLESIKKNRNVSRDYCL